MRRTVGPREVLDDLTAGLEAVLGDGLTGLYLHGSLVAGDFAPTRSDIDVLALVVRPPDDATLTAVAPVIADIEQRHPAWRGRLEVETVGLPTVEAFVSGDVAAGARQLIMRVSPGEELHLLPATGHRVLTWATVREKGQALVGPPAPTMLPAVSPELVRAALLQHVRDWPEWVEDMQQVGGQAYSVLSLCRAWCALVEGEQLSKRAAADRRATGLLVAGRGTEADLVGWARDWWYADGSDGETGRLGEVRDFVVRTCGEILGQSSGWEAERGFSPG
ncbi:aminoglycoside adenylyltransferase domain-containing protein [Terrabacter terrigena]|uniref:Aminoglycoside adenylyltransferase domain-containing protein n=1 Tax=Terrabacter terrigena TaxID=574718 RepID=A0ABW3MUG2_9MICO